MTFNNTSGLGKGHRFSENCFTSLIYLALELSLTCGSGEEGPIFYGTSINNLVGERNKNFFGSDKQCNKLSPKYKREGGLKHRRLCFEIIMFGKKNK